MDKFDVTCPNCKTINKDLYLWETEGRFVCEHCGKETQIKRFERPNRMPLYSSEEILTKVFVW